MKRRNARWNPAALIAALMLGALATVGISCQMARTDVRGVVAAQDDEDAGPTFLAEGEDDEGGDEGSDAGPTALAAGEGEEGQDGGPARFAEGDDLDGGVPERATLARAQFQEEDGGMPSPEPFEPDGEEPDEDQPDGDEPDEDQPEPDGSPNPPTPGPDREPGPDLPDEPGQPIFTR